MVAGVRPEDSAAYVGESSDRLLVLTVSGAFREPVVQIWDADSQAEVAESAKERSAIAESPYLPDGQGVLTQYRRKPDPSVWDAWTGGKLFALEVHRLGVRGIAVSQDGLRITTRSIDRTVRLWDARTGVAKAV